MDDEGIASVRNLTKSNNLFLVIYTWYSLKFRFPEFRKCRSSFRFISPCCARETAAPSCISLFDTGGISWQNLDVSSPVVTAKCIRPTVSIVSVLYQSPIPSGDVILQPVSYPTTLPPNQPIDQLTNQSTNLNQSTNQNQSINRSIDQPSNRLIKRSINQSITELANQ